MNDDFKEELKDCYARIEQLEAEAKTSTLDYLGQVGQLSEELERVKREAERAQDAHGVRFLNYLEETARLTDEIERLRSALEVAADRLFDAGLNDAWADARAALESGAARAKLDALVQLSKRLGAQA